MTTPLAAPAPAAAARPRVVAIDWMRGLVMMIMAVDHSSGEFNAGRLFTDGAFVYRPGTPLPTAQFLTRFAAHLCAPSFVFLAGTSLALSLARRRTESERSIDRHLLLRGLTIAGFELWVSLFWMPPGRVLFQVLYAIGTSFLFMIPLRRLPSGWLLAIASCIVLFGEAVIVACGWGPAGPAPLVASLLLVPGSHGRVIVAYPALPWLAMMIFGFVFGRRLATRPAPRAVRRGLTVAGVVLLALFGIVRGANGYGNMALPRESGALVQWLHVSKYPPSLTYDLLELGIMSLALAALYVVEASATPKDDGPMLVLGRTPMFFYLLHIPLLVLAAHALGVSHTLGLGATYGFAALVIAVLYPVCRVYRRYKEAHPDGWTRYL
ncbi:MAG TPA: heparan-alpha-glucosaminide N-acetyltransferase domain-containing protein [Polyangiaceae bacterium]|nr:heparan-alpha-glucosaminide N-acetyltransferase domain-containing protein [Polyangiaceae bacterium]